MPRVSKTKAPVAATPRRATRSTVRAGSASLEEPIEAPTPRRRSSRSKTPDSKNSSFDKSHVEHLPALTEEEEKQSPRVALPQPAEFAPIVDASPYVTPQHYHIAATTRNSLYTSPTVNQTVQQSVEVYVHEDEVDQVQEDQDETEDQDEGEEAVQEAVEEQLANETAEAGLSHSHPTPPSLKTPSASLAGHSSSRRRRSARGSAFARASDHSPLAQVSGNAGSSPASPIDFTKFLPASSPQRSPAFSSTALMDRSLKSDEFFGELTDRQRTALLMDMRREILRLRKVEEQYLAASKQSQSPAKSSPQPPAIQESSPDIPRTVNRAGDLRYYRSIATPARQRLLAQREAAAEAEKAAASEEEQTTQTPSRSSPSPADNKRKSKTSQTKTPEAQTPQRSSQTSAPAETPAPSPSWGLTSLFGSVKNIFTHRPNLSPIKQLQLQEQPQEQSQEHQQQEQPAPANQHNMFTPSPSKKQKRILSSSQQSPTPKPKSPAPPATPAAQEDGLYGERPRTVRRIGTMPGSEPRRRRGTPSKPKETNADLRASQLDLAAQKSAERQKAQEKAERLERERREIQEELKKRDLAYNTGDKRKVNVDDLAIIPRKEKGAGSGTYGLVDDFFNYDDDSDFVEMDEDEIHLLPASEHPAKRVRLDENVFQPKTPAAPPATISPVKQAAAPQPSAVPLTPAPNYSQLTQQAIEKQRLQFSQHQPKQPSRLRHVERLSTGSTIAASSPQQTIAPPLQDIQEVSPVPQLPKTPPPKVYQWPVGESMETPETWARIEKLYTPEMRAADHEYFTNGLIAAMANAQKTPLTV